MTDIPADVNAALTARRRDLRTLSACWREFWRHDSPRYVGAGVLAALVARLIAGRWSWHDALVPVVIVAIQPFVEWVIHKYLLHLPPFQFRGRRVELISSAEHRRHHRDPANLDGVLLSGVEALLFLAQIAGLAALIVWGSTTLIGGHFVPVWLTSTLCSYLGLFRYEWAHFLIHTPYVPKSRAYRTIWRNHRLHHFKHEDYWMGITSNLGDRVLRTNPDGRDVPRSETARSLGVES